MSKCPTPNCNEVLPVHSRRAYCYKCRATMGRWDKRSPREVLDYSKRLVRNIYRVEHIKERRLDQVEALTQLPANRRKPKK